MVKFLESEHKQLRSEAKLSLVCNSRVKIEWMESPSERTIEGNSGFKVSRVFLAKMAGGTKVLRDLGTKLEDAF